MKGQIARRSLTLFVTINKYESEVSWHIYVIHKKLNKYFFINKYLYNMNI